MSDKKKTVEVNGEYLLDQLETIDQASHNIRGAMARGIFQPSSAAGINTNAIDWRTKDNQPAGEDDPWSWAHAYHLNGPLKDETRQLVQEIERTGKVEVSGYEITLSGRDKKLLNRKKLGSQGRR